jgi:hypothetical protein
MPMASPSSFPPTSRMQPPGAAPAGGVGVGLVRDFGVAEQIATIMQRQEPDRMPAMSMRGSSPSSGSL